MDLDRLRRDNVDMKVYDNLAISFNDASGQLTSPSGDAVEFGKTLEWTLTTPFVEEEAEISSM